MISSKASVALQDLDEWVKYISTCLKGCEFAIGNHNRDLLDTLEELTDFASSSNDLCIYDLKHPRIG